MDEKQKKTLLFVVLGVIIVIILMNPGCKSLLGGGTNNNTGGDTPGGTHAPCEDCQARWINLHNWECTGTCSTGTCHIASANLPENYITNPYQRVDCSCGTPAVVDNCYTTGGYTAAMTCGGTCADTSKTCQSTITGVCTCQTRPLMCSEITSLGSPSDCADANCPITGQACQYDTGRGTCVCMNSYL